MKIFVSGLMIYLFMNSYNGFAGTDERLEMSFVYRTAGLERRAESVFLKEEYGDFVDQLYLSLKTAKEFDYRHLVLLEPVIRTKRNQPNETELLIGQAYISSSISDHLKLIAGKRAERSGSGFIVQPSDILNEKNDDQFDPLYRNEGVKMSSLRATYGSYVLGMGYLPAVNEDLDFGRSWTYLSGNISNLEFRMDHTYDVIDKSTFGMSISGIFFDTVELHYDGKYRERQRSEEIEIERPFSSFKYLESDDPQSSLHHLYGTRIILSPKRSVILEYIQNESGLLKEEEINFYKSLENNGREDETLQRLIGRSYAFFGYFDGDLIPSVELELSSLSNLDDQSSYAFLKFKYILSPLTSIELVPTVYQGEKYTEFGETAFSSVTQIYFRGKF